MARGPRYRVSYRRRREAKTDYRVRRIMATSGRNRFVVRSSNKNITIQLVTSKIEGDFVHTQANSSELEKFGWLGGKKNTSAAYLLGLLAGKKALSIGIDAAILDLGLTRPTKGAKVFAAVKGALDAGLEIPCDSDIIPELGRIEGRSVSEYAASFEDQPEFKKVFSGYLKRGLNPQDLPGHFETVKVGIMEASV
ncbi:50S ribosomal protein L18 [Candidatus Bathyarchaeota archaeon]|nr:50S ribosomal protein L18 [Candidatus Bathyarchaeota archaeon]